MDTKERRKMVKKKMKALGMKQRRNFVHIICTKCGMEDDIHTNNPAIYTDDVRKSYTCWKCKPPKKREGSGEKKEESIPLKEQSVLAEAVGEKGSKKASQTTEKAATPTAEEPRKP